MTRFSKPFARLYDSLWLKRTASRKEGQHSRAVWVEKRKQNEKFPSSLLCFMQQTAWNATLIKSHAKRRDISLTVTRTEHKSRKWRGKRIVNSFIWMPLCTHFPYFNCYPRMIFQTICYSWTADQKLILCCFHSDESRVTHTLMPFPYLTIPMTEFILEPKF